MDLFAQLGPLGFSKEGLPPKFGGTWSYGRFAEWLASQRCSTVPASTTNKDSRVIIPQKDRTPSTSHDAKRPFDSVHGSVVSVAAAAQSDSAEAMLPPPIKKKHMASQAESPHSCNNTKANSSPEATLERFNIALKLIPYSEREAYTEALQRAPLLVATESDPMSSLRCEDFNAFKAAFRVMSYWKKRKSLFGSRAFLPMDQTGEGALTVQDIEMLNSGSLAFLHNDSSGRVVLCANRHRIASAMTAPEGRLRCVFYMLSVASEPLVSQTEGIVMVRIITTPSFRLNVQAFMKITEALPPRIACFALFCVPENPEARRIMRTTVVPALTEAMHENHRDKLVIYLDDSPEDLVKKLQRAGFVKQGLPLCVGGTWEYDSYTDWQRDRVAQEWKGNHGKPHPSAKQYCHGR